MDDIPRVKVIGERRDYRVEAHHVQTPTVRIITPAAEPLLSWEEAERKAGAERAKGYMMAWVVGRDGLAASRPTETDHFMKCPACGGYFDMRDLGAVFAHDGPLPHPVEDKVQ